MSIKICRKRYETGFDHTFTGGDLIKSIYFGGNSAFCKQNLEQPKEVSRNTEDHFGEQTGSRTLILNYRGNVENLDPGEAQFVM